MAALNAKTRAQENAFRKVAKKQGYVSGTELERANKERKRLAGRGVNLAIYQVLLKLGLLDITQVKQILGEIDKCYFFCAKCHRENSRRKNGDKACRYCQGTGLPSRRLPVQPEKTQLPPKKEDPMLGKALGACQIIEKLGEGGSGVVYKARQLSLDRLVAVKVLYPWLAVQEDRARRFLREAKAMARVEHPNVVPIYDYGRERGAYYLVMSYQEGSDLGQLVKRRNSPMPFEETLDIVAQTLEGLGALHDAGVIHRDLKPENIQITPSGRAMVMDFGLVRDIKPTDSLTQSEQIVGTPFYMSPEQCLNKDVDARTDIYSLGVTFYQMLTGVRPFGGENAVELIMGHLFEKPTPPHEMDDAVSPEASAVVLKMLAKDKRGRYPTTRSALEDVGRLKRGEMPLAMEFQQRGVRKSRLRRAAVALLVLVAIGAGAWGLLREGDTPDPGTDEPDPLAVRMEVQEAAALDVLRATTERESRLRSHLPRTARERDFLLGEQAAIVARYEAIGDPDTGLYRGTQAGAEAYIQAQELKKWQAPPPSRPIPELPEPPPDRPTPEPRLTRAQMSDLEGLDRAVRDRIKANQYNEARALIERLVKAEQDDVIRDLLTDHIHRVLRLHELVVVAEARYWRAAFRSAEGLEVGGKRAEAIALLRGLESRINPTDFAPIQTRITTLEREIAAERLAAERAALERLKVAWREVQAEVVGLLRAEKPSHASSKLDKFEHEKRAVLAQLGEAPKALRADIQMFASVWRAAKMALQARAGQAVRLSWREVKQPRRGELSHDVKTDTFSLKSASKRWSFRLPELDPRSVNEHAGAVSALSRATYCYYTGTFDLAIRELARVPNTQAAARDRLARLVRQGRVDGEIERAATALRGGKLQDAYIALKRLEELDTDGIQDRATLYQDLARLIKAGQHAWDGATRTLYRLKAEKDPERFSEWRANVGEIVRSRGGWVWDLTDSMGQAGGMAMAWSELKRAAPYRVSVELSLEKGAGPVGLWVGQRLGSRLILEHAPKLGYRAYQRTRGTDKGPAWKALEGSTAEGRVTLRITVLGERVLLYVGEKPFATLKTLASRTGIGLVGAVGTKIRLTALQVETLVRVPHE